MENTTIPNCKVCSKEVTRFIKSTNSWWKWCSMKCMGSDPDVIAKKNNTNAIKHGGHPMHISALKDKQKATVIKNYGVDNPSKSKAVQQTMKNTFIKNYGVDNPSKNTEVIDKIRNAAITRYTTDKDAILSKRISTCLDTYQVTTNKHLHLSADAIEKMKDLDWLYEQHIVQKRSCQDIADSLGCSPTPILLFLVKNGIQPVRHNVSGIETAIQSYISTLTSDAEYSTRSVIPPYEIDILLPSKNTAIEVNGVYWHSELMGKDRNYHLSKTVQCADKNIQLWHIYDLEWINSEHIVKSKISGLFNQHTKISARKCVIKLVPTAEKTAFLNANHLQGACGSSVNLGLYFNDELVMIMTFGKSRFNKLKTWELIRLCSKTFVTVQGGASKLFTYFCKTYSPSSVVSYADRRWSTGRVYEMLNFTHLHNSLPNYFYFKNATLLESRIKYQKHKLKEKFNLLSADLSEWEIMQSQGFNRIWDCGNMVYLWTNYNET